MAQTNGNRANGASLAEELFQDMGTKVSNMGAANGTGDDENEQRIVDEIESLCMNCHADGTTRMLLTRIPFFHEIVIMSFSCPECHYQNNQVQSAGQIQEKGAKYALRVQTEADLQRLVVKSDTGIFRIEDLDLEIPPGKGQYTNVEGVISGITQDLEMHQDERMRQMPEVGEKIAGVIASLKEMVAGRRFPFMISGDDISGNSWIEPKPGEAAGKWAKSEYNRTPAQNATLGLGEEEPADGTGAPETEIRPEYHTQGMVPSLPIHDVPVSNNVDDDDIVENQVYSFPAQCSGCTKPCATNMKMVNIPHFKQVILMSTVCDSCGYRSNEVKTGGEVPEKGRQTTLRVRNKEDLSRDILKGESAALECPELELRVEAGTMGGRFTTVEGILTQIKGDLRAQVFGLSDGNAEVPEGAGDGMATESKQTWESFFAKLAEAIDGKVEFTLILKDPLAGSYVQSFTAPEPDSQIDVLEYDRTDEEEEDLGLKDIKTEGYEQDAPAS